MSQEIDLSTITVLVVDDSGDNLDLIEEYLDGVVWSVIRAGSGEACIGLALEHEPDVILLDLMMPNMNGLSVIRSIRAMERLAHIPVILQTAYADRDNILAARRLGCNYILAKPLSRDRLLAEVRKALAESAKPARSEQESPEDAKFRKKDLIASARTAKQVLEDKERDQVAAKIETVECLQNLIKNESPIGQQLIQVANSPRYAGITRITTVREAVVRIGLREAKMLIKKASPRVLAGANSAWTIRALDLLETITKLFPERASTEQGLLSLLDEFGSASLEAVGEAGTAVDKNHTD